MELNTEREIPWNYTSEDDASIVVALLGQSVWNDLQELKSRRKTGRSARHVLRVIGDLFVLRRNAFLYHEFVMSQRQQKLFLKRSRNDITAAKARTQGDVVAERVLDACSFLLDETQKTAQAQRILWLRGSKKIARIIGAENCSFEPYDLVAHSTDATDWRHHLPVFVVKPGNWQEVKKLVRIAKRMNLRIIPRGGGTGLTGGAVPLVANVMMLNTERLNCIEGIFSESIAQSDGSAQNAWLLKVQSGVTTEDAMAMARKHNLVFATDPTSSWACTVGGNLSENAGGKSAVAWGTAIDNVISFRIINPTGEFCEVRRKFHPLRKIFPDDDVTFEIVKEKSSEVLTITLKGEDIRKRGLWKDVSNKWLGGVPGLQKEGTDGVIVDATFLLHKDFPVRSTICLEFFGPDMDNAALCIKELREKFALGGSVCLAAMEHFDAEYCAAIVYKTKTKNTLLADNSFGGGAQIAAIVPKAVLLVDLGATEPKDLESGIGSVQNISARYNGVYVHVAASDIEAKSFWSDRKKLGAIAKRTNAFKLNEDIVLPIEKLAEFVRFCDSWNKAERIEHNIFPNKQLIIATHMHAGDGNIHVNIPVFSNDREMLKRAHSLADTVMALAKDLGGAVSGEHGIGITKVKYLENDSIHKLTEYRKKVDPHNIFNPRKLADKNIMDEVFTPSFNLLGLEARILQHGRLSNLAAAIASCVRCGKCKPVCSVHAPQSKLFFSPRDKILAIGALIEATLYDTQRAFVFRTKLQKGLRNIADHCTLCHKCADVCPVGIDKGSISLLEREILSQAGLKRQRTLVRGALAYLASRSRPLNSAFRATLLVPGLKAQRTSHTFLKPFLQIPALQNNYVAQLLASAPKPPPWKTFYSYLPSCGRDSALVLHPQTSQVDGTVFYFPGCGSERLFSDIAAAAAFLLLKKNFRVILAPHHLCCGFPHAANAAGQTPNQILLRNSIVFSRLREMIAHWPLDACVVTCGTCKEALQKMELDNLLGTHIKDVVGFLEGRGMANGKECLEESNKQRDALLSVHGSDNGSDNGSDKACAEIFYHTPCHDSLNGGGAATLQRITNTKTHTLTSCCSEAGTMALSRPDISQKLRAAKNEEINCALHSDFACAEKKSNFTTKKLLVTNCPSCVQGLSRQEIPNLRVEHITVLLAQALGGKNWKSEVRVLTENAERITF